VADGVDAVRLAAREELQKGATQIKIMASGGVASPTDPIGNTQYSEGRIRAIVAEAEAAQTYVMAHAYTGRAIARAVRCGVRTIEHGNLVDAEAARVMRRHGAFVVPTLVTYDSLARDGARLGLPPDSVAKIESVRQAGRDSLRICRTRRADGLRLRPAGRDASGPVGNSDPRRPRQPETIARPPRSPPRILQRDGELGCARRCAGRPDRGRWQSAAGHHAADRRGTPVAGHAIGHIHRSR
jgi:hypothetical protein